jgi:DNA-binding SARP family transcriptional activator
LRKAGERVVLPMSMQRLVALLALRDRPLHRLYISGLLWLDTSEERASASLRTAVWRLRRVDRNLIATTPTHVGLGGEVSVDVHETLDQARRLLDPTTQCDGTDLHPASLSAELLPDWYDDWVLLEQERFRQIRMHALEALCERLTAAHCFGAAVQAGIEAVAAEPLRESAQRVLMCAYLSEGNVYEAVRQYCSYRTILHAELGLEPSQLIKDVLRGLPMPALANVEI